jgi:beta-N-acetylhexosaminidase
MTMSDLHRAAARMIGVGFHTPAVPKEIEALIDRGVSCAILFSRNVETVSQVQQLANNLKRRADRPFIISIDQEGGRVRRLRQGFTDLPSMRELGRTGDAELAREIGRVIGRELRAVNIDHALAPVLDVDTNPNNPVIADRSLGPTPELVTRLGCALIDGLQGEGVAACGKHFPGHGDTPIDSHYDLPRLQHPLERLERIELPPFEAAVKCNVATIMTAHVIFDPIDSKYPSTMSRQVMDGILRQRMGFNRVVVSDDLEMKAIANYFSIEEVVIHCANAGVDMFLICHNHDLQNQAIDILIKAVERGDVPMSRIEEANRRIDELMNRYVKPPSEAGSLDVVGSPAHQAIADRVLKRTEGADPTESWRR